MLAATEDLKTMVYTPIEFGSAGFRIANPPICEAIEIGYSGWGSRTRPDLGMEGKVAFRGPGESGKVTNVPKECSSPLMEIQ